MNKLILGDSKDKLKQIPDNSVDLLLSDPPYGISFMAKKWDTFKPGGAYEKKKGFKQLPRNKTQGMIEFFVPIWKECLRVLKHGSFAFVFCSPRQDVLCKQIIALEQAGFNVGFTSIYHCFASGFPKSSNIAKTIDKRLGRKRKVVGRNPNSREACDKSNTLFESGTVGKTAYTTTGTSEFEGWYTYSPKPALEIVLVVMKPLQKDCKTYIDQALKNRKSIVNFSACRIPYKTKDTPKAGKRTKQVISEAKPISGGDGSGGFDANVKGRFPGNLLVSDDVLNNGTIAGQSSKGKSYNYQGKQYRVAGFIKDNSPQAPSNYADAGSFSRYFSLDNWWVEKIKDLPPSVRKTFPFLILPKASRHEKDFGCENIEPKQFHDRGCSKSSVVEKPPEYKRKNTNPCVKPIKLMSYLITLASRPGDTVLDPFAGSFTTGVACKMMNRRFTGIEKNKEYFDIGVARIKATMKNLL